MSAPSTKQAWPEADEAETELARMHKFLNRRGLEYGVRHLYPEPLAEDMPTRGIVVTIAGHLDTDDLFALLSLCNVNGYHADYSPAQGFRLTYRWIA